MTTTKWLVIIAAILGISVAATLYWVAMKPTTTTQTRKDVWACPMHPEVTSEKAGNCHICGMPLEKKKEDL